MFGMPDFVAYLLFMNSDHSFNQKYLSLSSLAALQHAAPFCAHALIALRISVHVGHVSAKRVLFRKYQCYDNHTETIGN
jgi:hypothetical protein